jgi:DNA replication protein DnaC
MPTETINKPAISIVKNEVAEVCELCFGTGMQAVPDKGARPCPDCSKSPGQTLLEAARLPYRYANCTLDNFKCTNSSQEIALQYARCLVRDYPYIDRGLLFMGTVGVGKTHLAVAILKGLIERGRPCLFYEFGALLKNIQASYNPISGTSELAVLAPVYQTEVLVLDELGASIPTDWVRDTLYQIINTRYNDKKLTIFTTNRLDEALLRRFERGVLSDQMRGAVTGSRTLNDGNEGRKKTEKSLEERIGFPLRSRLYEMCNTILVEGSDFRKNSDKRQFDPV